MKANHLQSKEWQGVGRNILSWFGVAFGILALSLIVTYAAWRYAEDSIAKQSKMKFERETEAIISRIRDRMEVYLDALDGFRALFIATPPVDRKEFASYYQEVDVRSKYPGIVAVSFVERVSALDKRSFIERIRSDTSLSPTGYPDFTIHPDTEEKAEYFVVNYLEPYAQNEKAQGFDVSSEAARFSAMERAQDTAEATLTERVTLITDAEEEPGFVAFIPIYRQGGLQSGITGRRTALLGFIVGAFRAHDLFTSLLEKVDPTIDVEVFDGGTLTEDHLLYDARPQRLDVGSAKLRGPHHIATVQINDRMWTLWFSAEPDFGLTPTEQVLPVAVLWVGIVFSLLVFGALLLLATARVRAMALAKDMTGDLEQANAELIDYERTLSLLLEETQDAKERLEEQNTELRLANVKLKELTTLKDEFVAKVSHELRTPLTSVKEGLSLLIDNALGQTTPEQQDFLKTMDADLDRLTELISNMLDISKIEAGRMHLNRTRLDLRTLLESLPRTYQLLLGHRTVRTELSNIPPVFADPHRIRQVFTNLFSNAMKFTDDTGTITFRAAAHDGVVTVAIEDTGPGIAADDLPKLFQKFSQVGPQGAGRPRGTGLGLVVCKELTELHGGRIDVASEVGHGTIFSVSLPVYTDKLALRESFREIVDVAQSDQEATVGLLAIQAEALLDARAEAEARQAQLERLADDIRHHVHRGDVVLPLEPAWVVILAVADHAGGRAIVKRLRETLPDGARLRFGLASQPAASADAAALFAEARGSVDSEGHETLKEVTDHG